MSGLGCDWLVGPDVCPELGHLDKFEGDDLPHNLRWQGGGQVVRARGMEGPAKSAVGPGGEVRRGRPQRRICEEVQRCGSGPFAGIEGGDRRQIGGGSGITPNLSEWSPVTGCGRDQ